MKIVVINGRFLTRPLTGVERFASEILIALDKIIEGNNVKYEVLVPNCKVFTNLPLRNIEIIRFGNRGGHLWEQIDLRRYSQSRDLLLNLCNTGPLFFSKSIICIHDAHVWLVPKNFSFLFRLFYKFSLPVHSVFSRGWFTVSNYSRDRLIESNLLSSKCKGVVYNGVDHIDIHNNAKKTVFNNSKPYLFALGSFSKNKNIEILSCLIPILHKYDIQLLISGGRNNNVFSTNVTQDSSAHIKWLGRLDDESMVSAMQNSLAFLFPSFYEGFGIPPVEAMRCGVPVIASNTSAMPEVLQDGVIYCSPFIQAEWIAAVELLISDKAICDKLRFKGKNVSSKYAWIKSAYKLRSIVEETLKNDK